MVPMFKGVKKEPGSNSSSTSKSEDEESVDEVNDFDRYSSDEESGEEMSSDGEDDPVVEEFDVFLTHTTSNDDMYILQYPTRPVYRPSPTPARAMIKKNNKLLKVQYDMHTEESEGHFDETDEMEVIEGQSVNKDLLRYLTLSSKEVPIQERSYAIGIIDINEKQVYLTPVTGICEMLPDLSKLDEPTCNTEDAQNGPLRVGQTVLTSSGSSSGPKAVEVFNLRAESEEAETRRHNSYAYLKHQEELEPWEALQIYGRESEMAEATFQRLVDHSQESSSYSFSEEGHSYENSEDNASFTLSATGYMDKIAPRSDNGYLGDLIRPIQQRGSKPNTTSAGPGKPLSLYEQIEQLFRSRDMLRTDDVFKLVPNADRSKMKTLGFIQKVAVLVRGIWVIKSDIYFKNRFGTEETKSKRSVSSHILAANNASEFLQNDAEINSWVEMTSQTVRKCALRDLVLSQFCKIKGGSVSQKNISSLVKVQTQALREVFMSVATPNKLNRIWTLKLKDDRSFCEENSSIAKAEGKRWQLRELRALLALGVDVDTAKKYVTSNNHYLEW